MQQDCVSGWGYIRSSYIVREVSVGRLCDDVVNLTEWVMV